MKKGEYVVYGGSEICLIDGIEEKCFDGVNKLSYYRLIPCETPKSTYYVPDDKLAERTRPLLTREEILAVIDEMPTVRAEWILDKNSARAHFPK